MQPNESAHRQRQSTRRVLILVALAIAAGRIAVVTRDGVTAFLSANDRSRWCTVAALVEHGTYAIDAQEAITVPNPISKKAYQPWKTIDKVRHSGADGKLHYYSSKPPLLPTLVAGVYAILRPITGMTLSEQPMYMTRIVLAVVNLPLLALFYFATAASIDRICRSQWASRMGVIAVCFGTMILPFAISLNNHLPAAAATAAAMWIYLMAAHRLDRSDDQEASEPTSVSPWWWFAAGTAAAFAAANELPALSMMVFWGLLFAMLCRLSILPFAAGVTVVAIGFFGTNWIAHQSLRPPYAHRGNGALIAEFDGGEELSGQTQSQVKSVLVGEGLIDDSTELSIRPSDEAGRWIVDTGGQLFALLKSTDRHQVAHWDDWYEYPRTHWKPENLKGVDAGEASRFVYFAHMTVGHHGLFSLTPIWLLVPIGLIAGLGFGPIDFRRLVLAVLIASVVCVAFYVARPEIDRNYGGVSVCFRWLLWFAPLWMLVIAPVMDRFAEKRMYRNALKVMLAISVFSMSTALSSPWQHPWLYQYWQFLNLFGLD